MKKLRNVLALLLALCFVLSLAACGNETKDPDPVEPDPDPVVDPTEPDPTPDEPALTVADIAGTYELDGSNWGMNLKWYITINADATFTITNDKGVNKGDGTVAGKDNVFMLLYSDSTAEKSKSATFTYADDTITFSTSVPIGTATISSNDDHPENVFATKTTFTPSAGVSYVSGDYVANVGGMTYNLTVTAEKTYTFSIVGAMTLNGSFTTNDNQLVAADGTFTATVGARMLTVNISGQDVVFYHSSIQGNFKGEEPEGETNYAAELLIEGADFTLKTGTADALTYFETTGTIITKDNYVYFAYADGETTLVGVASDNDIAVQDIPVADGVTTSMSFKAYTPEEPVEPDEPDEPAGEIAAYVGTYVGSQDKVAMGTSVHYDFAFEIKGDNTYAFTSTFTMGGGTYTCKEEGTIAVAGSAVTIKALKKVTAATMESGELVDIAEADQAEVTGTIADGVITIALKASPMASAAADLTLTKESGASTYVGSLDKVAMGTPVHYDFAFEIKGDGTYAFTSTFAMGGGTYTCKEEGTITVAGSAVTIKALRKVTAATMETGELVDIAEADQAEVTGTIADGVLTIALKASPMASAAADLTLTLSE